jgi:hypothetical protein
MLIVLNFLLLWKVPEIKNLKEERIILAYSFRGFSAWSAGAIAFRPVASTNILEEGHG